MRVRDRALELRRKLRRERLRRLREARDKRSLLASLAGMVERGECRFTTGSDGRLLFFEAALDESSRQLW